MLRRVIVTFFLAAILASVFAGPARADGVDELTFTYTFESNTYAEYCAADAGNSRLLQWSPPGRI